MFEDGLVTGDVDFEDFHGWLALFEEIGHEFLGVEPSTGDFGFGVFAVVYAEEECTDGGCQEEESPACAVFAESSGYCGLNAVFYLVFCESHCVSSLMYKRKAKDQSEDWWYPLAKRLLITTRSHKRSDFNCG